MRVQRKKLGDNTKMFTELGRWTDGTRSDRTLLLNESLGIVYTGSCTSTAFQFRAKVVSSLLFALHCSIARLTLSIAQLIDCC